MIVYPTEEKNTYNDVTPINQQEKTDPRLKLFIAESAITHAERNRNPTNSNKADKHLYVHVNSPRSACAALESESQFQSQPGR